MKRLFLLVMILLSGCLVRTYVVDQRHPEPDPNGNHGFIVGKAKENQKVMRVGKNYRNVIVFEIETGPHKPANKPEAPVEESAGSSDSSYSDTASDSVDYQQDTSSEAMAVSDNADKSYTEYKVQANDTLQKISQKLYGTTKRWQEIYAENRDILSTPDKIYLGLVIKVPAK